MALEMPSSLIREFQTVLRKEAGVPSYDPTDPTLRGFPTLEEAILGLGPSTPPYLRCRKCRATLLRGIQSTVCVYCGAEQRREGPPQTISFNSTVGYRKFLESLDLDGSEAVSFDTESKDSSKGRDTVKDGLVLSGLLDFELRWPLEKEEVQSSRTNEAPTQSTYSLNLSGVDLDNFFSETSAPHISEELLLPKKEIINREPHVSSDTESFGLLENLRSSDKTVGSVDTKAIELGDSFAVWEAEFQSAGSEIPVADPNSNDFIQVSSPIDFSSPLRSTATGEKKTNTETEIKREGITGGPPSSVGQLSSVSDPDDQWPTAGVGVSNTAKHFKNSSKADDCELKSNNITSTGDSWIQDDLWPTSCKRLSSNAENVQDNDDWQDFTSSGRAPEGLSNSWTQTGIGATLPNEHVSDVNLVALTDKLDDVEFGRIFQSDVFSEVSGIQKESSDVNNMQLEASVSDRMNESEKTETDKNEKFSPTKQPENANSTAEVLQSQMHDLSFMLESNLSIPKKVENSDSTP